MKNKDNKIINQELNELIMKNKYFHLMLGICRYCKHFNDMGVRVKNHIRYRCEKKESSIYEAYFCKKTDYLRGQLEISI